MTFSDGLITDFNNTVNQYGLPVVLKFYSASGATAGYDDNYALVQSGASVWCFGIPQTMNTSQRSDEHVMTNMGRVKTEDTVLYIAGSVYTCGSQPMKIGMGSPTSTWFTTMDYGLQSWETQGVLVYKKLYCRFLPAGSLPGE